MTTKKPSMRGVPDKSLTLNLAPVEALDLSGRTLLVVGGTDGLGRALARQAAARGAKVIVVGRTFRDTGVPGLSFHRADLSSLKAALSLGRTFEVEGLDTVVFTTGIFAARVRQLTDEGIERDMAVSYLSRLAIVRGLAPRLRASGTSGNGKARIFVMGFPGAGNLGDASDLNAEQAYDRMTVHLNTVAGNEMLVLDGSRRYPHVGFYGLNPGLIKTNIRANLFGDRSLMHRAVEFLIGLTMQSAGRYAAHIVPLLYAPELEQRSGLLFGAKARAILPSPGMTDARVAQFIAASNALIDRAAEEKQPLRALR
jgi:NAD(P)-dependent dehydrogenase (short-subunit alcohol dehydrogenase family)